MHSFIKVLLSAMLITGALGQKNIVEIVTGITKGEIESSANFTTLLSLLGKRPELVTALSDNTKKFTVFAPTDEAFAKITVPSDDNIVTNILKYHVVDSVPEKFPVILKTLYKEAGLKNEAQVLKAEGAAAATTVTAGTNQIPVVTKVDASNGVIYVIPTVLQFPEGVAATLDKAGIFKTLKKALQDTSLLEVVGKSQQITIFAPTDAAFEAFAKLKQLPSGDALANVLKYHVVPSVAYSTDFKETKSVSTLLSNDKTLKIEPKDGKVFVNGIEVTTADVAISNGVVHVISGVLEASSGTDNVPKPTPSKTGSGAARGSAFCVLLTAALFAAQALI